MKPYDERLQYYLMLARLLAEADLQLEADADDPGSAPYGAGLADLRAAMEAALVSVMQITTEVQALRAQTSVKNRATESRTIRH